MYHAESRVTKSYKKKLVKIDEIKSLITSLRYTNLKVHFQPALQGIAFQQKNVLKLDHSAKRLSFTCNK